MRCVLLGFLALWLTPAGHAMFVYHEVEKVPVDRVLTNLEKKLAAAPDDFDLHYQLARVHAMAAVLGDEGVSVIKDARDPQSVGRIQFGSPGSDNGTPETWDARRGSSGSSRKPEATHLASALRHYETAMNLMRKAPDRTRVTGLILPVQLGYGWCLEKAGRRAEAIAAYRQTLAIAWHQEITSDFDPADWFKGLKYEVPAFKLPVKPDSKMPFGARIGPGVCFSEEAVRYLLALLDPRNDAVEIGVLNERKKAMSGMGRWVTPILIPLSDAPFDALVAPEAHVTFDLDGSGVPRPWGWLKPQAAWLVFDGQQTGRITSGLQLFGSVTFWVFWRDGYQALGSLDANGDGVLEGDELKGLALWQDTNGNGISEPGEVKPLSAYGIDRLSCRGESAGPGLRLSRQGVHFKDGTSRPSYDWDVPMNAVEAAK